MTLFPRLSSDKERGYSVVITDNRWLGLWGSFSLLTHFLAFNESNSVIVVCKNWCNKDVCPRRILSLNWRGWNILKFLFEDTKMKITSLREAPYEHFYTEPHPCRPKSFGFSLLSLSFYTSWIMQKDEWLHYCIQQFYSNQTFISSHVSLSFSSRNTLILKFKAYPNWAFSLTVAATLLLVYAAC